MHPFARQGLLRRGGPFAVAALLPFCLVALPPSADAHASAAGFGLTVAILAAAVLVPWRRLPVTAAVVPPLALLPPRSPPSSSSRSCATLTAAAEAAPACWSAFRSCGWRCTATAGRWS